MHENWRLHLRHDVVPRHVQSRNVVLQLLVVVRRKFVPFCHFCCLLYQSKMIVRVVHDATVQTPVSVSTNSWRLSADERLHKLRDLTEVSPLCEYAREDSCPLVRIGAVKMLVQLVCTQKIGPQDYA